MAKIRVYELAKELGKDNKEMEGFIRGLGVEIKGVMSTLDDDQAQMVRRRLSGPSEPSRSGGAGRPSDPTIRREPDRRDGPGAGGAGAPGAGGPAMVIRRRSVGPRPGEEDESSAPPAAPPRAEPPRPSFGSTGSSGSSGSSGPSAGTNPAIRRPVPPVGGPSGHVPSASSQAFGSPSSAQAGGSRPTSPPVSNRPEDRSPFAGFDAGEPEQPRRAPERAPEASEAPTHAAEPVQTPREEPTRSEPVTATPTASAPVREPAPVAPRVESRPSTPVTTPATPVTTPASTPQRSEPTRPANPPFVRPGQPASGAPQGSQGQYGQGARPGAPQQPYARPGGPQQQPQTRPGGGAPTRAPAQPQQPQPRPGEVESKPAVGTRIQLPANTRRLPGGIAARMEDGPQGRETRDTPREMPHVRHGGDRRGEASPPSPSPIGQPLKPGVQTRPGPGRPGATGITGTRPLQTTGTKPMDPPPSQQQPPQQPQRTGPVLTGNARSVDVTRGPQGTPVATRSANPTVAPAAPRPNAAAPTIETDEATGRRVVRNESGVIVGAASQRAEPKIVGFIPLANRARPQQVIITDASETEQRGRATVRKQREERAQAQGRRRKMTVRNMGRRPGGPLSTRITTQEMSEAKKRIRVDEVIQIADLAHQMGKKATAVLRVLWGMGMRGLTINNVIDSDTAELVASEFGYTVDNVAFQEDEFIEGWDEAAGETRAPVVTIMGHVDHGKTSLLDKIRKTAVATGEAGGITQHIGAYKVSTPKGDVVFLDTPGHEAFSAMRTRGAQVTDVVVLVVAADDGIMPTTIEAIKHARDANVPIVVAINKIDKPDANPGRIKQMLMEYHLVGEEFGGETIIVEVSAKTGKNIDQLLEMLAVQAEILDLRATSEGRAQGVVLEARVDKGRGPISTVLVEAGTLVKGDIVVANEYSGKVRGLLDDKGKTLDTVGPSTPVELLGLDGVPSAGDRFNVVENEKAARQLIAHRRETRRRKESVRSGPSIQDFIQRKKTPTLKIVMRADVQGSAEALKQALLELSTEKVKVEVILAGVGAITQTDVKMASAGDAVIIGFNAKPVGKAAQTADAEKVQIYTFNVIYDALDKTRELMLGLLEPEYREREQGEAEVRALFPIPKIGVVAGCRVTRGLIQRSSHVRVVRRGTVIHKGRIASLRVLKDDVKEVREGFECGIVIDSFPEIEPGDIIQAFDMETLTPTL
jgi:translation initiation factor IF-2